jgi:hypothetical protein
MAQLEHKVSANTGLIAKLQDMVAKVQDTAMDQIAAAKSDAASSFAWLLETYYGFKDEATLTAECESWYESDKAKGTDWLAEVNRLLPCPCTTTQTSRSHVATKNPDQWIPDSACLRYELLGGCTFHSGADGCLRSVGSTPSGAGQQCCYLADGTLIGPDQSGTGTPDRVSSTDSTTGHFKADVEPYMQCCTHSSTCHYYMELRRGNNDHCVNTP